MRQQDRSEREAGVYMRIIIGVFFIVTYASITAALFLIDIENNREPLNRVLGIMDAVLLIIVGFYYSSTAGSKGKDEAAHEQRLYEIECKHGKPGEPPPFREAEPPAAPVVAARTNPAPKPVERRQCDKCKKSKVLTAFNGDSSSCIVCQPPEPAQATTGGIE